MNANKEDVSDAIEDVEWEVISGESVEINDSSYESTTATIVGVEAGTSKIQATIGTKKVSLTVKVTSKGGVYNSIGIYNDSSKKITSHSMEIGDTYSFALKGTKSGTSSAVYIPYEYVDDCDITVSDEKITTATLAENIAHQSVEIILRGRSAGSTKVSVTFGGKTTSLTVKVTAKDAGNIKLNTSSKSVKAGNTFTLKASTTTKDGALANVTWASSDSKVATVRKLSNTEAEVTAVGKGTAVITATSGTLKAQCTVKVSVNKPTITFKPSSVKIKKGNTKTITATIKNVVDGNAKITWEIVNPNKSGRGKVEIINSDNKTYNNGKATVTVKGTKVGDKPVEVKCTVEAYGVTVSKTFKVTVK